MTSIVSAPLRPVTAPLYREDVPARSGSKWMRIVPLMSSRLPKDRCPGLLRPFIADDGAIIRLRKPGGRIATTTLVALAETVTSYGSPGLHLTSRGNIEARALPVPLPDRLVETVVELGLLPSVSHERVRNIFANPLNPELISLVSALDEAICADPGLVELPGRFWFGFTDSTELGLTEPLDIVYQRLTSDSGRLIVRSRALPVSPDRAVSSMLKVARAFLSSRPTSQIWNIRDLPDDSAVFAGMNPIETSPSDPLMPGQLGDDLVVGLPLGDLTLDQAKTLVLASAEIVCTPWRAVVVPGGTGHAGHLAEAGLIVSTDSAWGRVSACSGAPYCRNTDRPTMQIAAELVHMIDPEGPHIHLAGCERHCGASADERIIYPDDLSDAMAQLSR